MRKIFIFLFLINIVLIANSQNRCGTSQNILDLNKRYPSYEQARLNVNNETNEWIKLYDNYKLNNIISIPVVVHVVWRNNSENISDAQVISQIKILNNDYRRTNIDVINTPSIWQNIAADCEIEFCLATVDPEGNSTNGINRVQTTQNSFGIIGDPVMSSTSGGANPWDQDTYLNIWVCNLSNGLLGYASPPSIWPNPNDGVVIGYKYFGDIGTVQSPYHKGRTTTHEVGHWLNLEHLWGSFGSCGDDQVSDTPKQDTENYSCPAFPRNPNSCNTVNPNGDMFMNYMDYTNDACMNLFTQGQKTRMLSAINQYRPGLLTQNICNGTTNLENKSTDQYENKIIKVIDVLGRDNKEKKKNTVLFHIYSDGKVKKTIVLE